MLKKFKKVGGFLLLILISCTPSIKNKHKIIELNQNWKFTSEIYQQSFDATIPGSIHTDLFNNQLIPDPFKGANESQLQWIDTLDWIYYKEFKRPRGLNPNSQLELLFKSIDTYADVFLNDSLLFTANNMFTPWSCKIKQHSLIENNQLKIVLKSPTKEDAARYLKLAYELPGGPRVVARKAAYHYGWDWGPKYITSGIWQDIELHIWNKAMIKGINYSIEKIDSSLASVILHANIESNENFTGKFKINCPIPGVNKSTESLEIKKGIKTYDIKLKIYNPQLWWTHNFGKPFLYPFEFELKDNNKILDATNLNIGLRTIELIKEPDSFGESFYLRLNGVPVFMKGANYIPQSSFPGTVSNKQYKKIISDVTAANMNMLRIWGGGIYEKDIFYDLCDEAGILIWQDFMFANAMYPQDSIFIENIKKEAKFQVNRLKKHPSLALWCGNNEIDEAWHNWGWTNSYSKKDSAEIWDNYKTIFHVILPEIVKTCNPEVGYTSSSPLFGRGNPRSSFEGDNHYWYVWHDAYDFDWYNKVTGRFMSEFGFQSFPDIETIECFDSSENKSIDSKIMLAHQKHWRGNYLINHHMKDYYFVPASFEDYIYVSQLLQAEGIRTGILAQRRAKPFCMGSLYWQLNDCWPAISWSSLNYSGNWKALHYFTKEDFKNIIINPYIHKDTVEIHVVSDSLKNLKANLKISTIDFDGNIKNSESIEINIPENSSKLYHKKSAREISEKYPSTNHFILTELVHQNKIIDTRITYLEKPKNLQLKKPVITYKINHIKNGYEINLQSTTLTKNLYIDLPIEGHWSKNYFDLIPGIEKKILFTTTKKISNINDQIKFKSLNDI